MKRWFAKWIGWVRIVALVGLAFGLVIRVGDPQPLKTLRNATFDFYHQTKPRAYQPQPVAILDVDDRSIEQLGQWPWPRTRIAEMVRKATEGGAVAIAFDIVFAEPDRLSPGELMRSSPELQEQFGDRLELLPDNDEALAKAFAESRVIVGQATVRSVAGFRGETRELAPVQYALIGPDPKPYMMQFPDIVQNLPELEATASGRGMFSTRPDPDGVYRRVPLVMSVEGNIRLGLSPELLRVATGSRPFAIRTNEAGIEGVVLAGQLVPTARDGTVWPYLTHANPVRYVSVVDLIEGKIPPQRLAGHLVLVGTSAIGLEDFRATPLGVAMAGVEIHAQVLENIISQTLLIRPNYTIAIELVTTFILCLLVIIFAPAMTASGLILCSLILLTGYVGFSYYMFQEKRVLLDPSFPLLATVIAIMLISTVNYLREERQRRQIRGAFGQYVSPDLVDQLTKNQNALTLGGESRELTLLFSDVRGFTAIAEEFRDDPEALTLLMNQFLTILSNGIMDHKGTIDKFMGDAVMAFWNAPLDNSDHVRSACRAALRMIEDIEVFNLNRMSGTIEQTPRTRKKGRRKGSEKSGKKQPKVHRLNVGIGINTGQCVVGNMGSDTRFDYTALGDPVNVASRLEGQSRYYGAPIILGQSTASIVKDEFALIELDMIRVVGKEVPENIFALIGNEEVRKNPIYTQAQSYNAMMLKAYRSRDWNGVERELLRLRQSFDSLGIDLNDYLEMYRARIAELRENPPDENWDGVFDSTKK